MREFRTFTCRIGPLLEVDLTKKESLADPKFAILAESYVLQQPPTAQVNQGTVRKQNIQMISLLKV